jgi:hypothetical protein
MAPVLVDGGLRVDDVLLAHEPRAPLLVRGDLRAGALVSTGHLIHALGDRSITHDFESLDPPELRQMRELFGPQIVGGDPRNELWLEADRLRRAIRTGRTWLRAP